jgi:hypothetical protein
MRYAPVRRPPLWSDHLRRWHKWRIYGQKLARRSAPLSRLNRWEFHWPWPMRSTFASSAPRRRKVASLRVVRGLSRGWARGPGLGGSLAEFQGHKEPASRMDQVVFALRPPGQQVEMLAEMLEVLKAPFDQMPARSRALGFDANRGRETESGCSARPARWQEPFEA